MKKNNLQGKMIQGPVSNKLLMTKSPLEKIAKVIDFNFPLFIKNVLDLTKQHLEEQTERESEKMKETCQNDLVELFWSVVRKGNVFDLIFFNDYFIYINFFLQYPVVTGEKFTMDMKCKDVVEKYQQLYDGTDMPGIVSGTNQEGDYFLIISGEENSGIEDTEIEYNENASIEGDVLQEVFQIDETIARTANNKVPIY